MTFPERHVMMSPIEQMALTKTVGAEGFQRADGWCESVCFPPKTHPFRAGELKISVGFSRMPALKDRACLSLKVAALLQFEWYRG